MLSESKSNKASSESKSCFTEDTYQLRHNYDGWLEIFVTNNFVCIFWIIEVSICGICASSYTMRPKYVSERQIWAPQSILQYNSRSLTAFLGMLLFILKS